MRLFHPSNILRMHDGCLKHSNIKYLIWSLGWRKTQFSLFGNFSGWKFFQVDCGQMLLSATWDWLKCICHWKSALKRRQESLNYDVVTRYSLLVCLQSWTQKPKLSHKPKNIHRIHVEPQSTTYDRIGRRVDNITRVNWISQLNKFQFLFLFNQSPDCSLTHTVGFTLMMNISRELFSGYRIT